MSEKKYCLLCGEPLEDIHDLVLCEKTELLKGRATIKRLNESIRSWKDAWFQLREIIGWLWWHHPAIDSDERRAYYQNNLNKICEKQNLS
jgi:hypothetical protein